MCKVSISQTFYFYNPSCPSSPLHQSPRLQFISFLASLQILKSARQGILTVGSGCGEKQSHSIPPAQPLQIPPANSTVKWGAPSLAPLAWRFWCRNAEQGTFLAITMPGGLCHTFQPPSRELMEHFPLRLSDQGRVLQADQKLEQSSAKGKACCNF